jgi:hypothetical protein
MGISLFTGRNSPSASVLPAYDTVGEFLKMFEARFGSTNCRDLTGCDLGTDEGQNYFKKNNLLERCKGYTEEATRMAMLLIQQNLAAQAPQS